MPVVTALLLVLALSHEPTFVWFNLLRFTPESRWEYVDSVETLEACQDLRKQYEEEQPGNYYCLPAQVKIA